MNKCKFAKIVNNKMMHYDCEEVRLLLDKWKKDFRKNNGTNEILKRGMKDRAYETFCNQIEDFLKNCTCEEKMEPIEEKCNICDEKDHEGIFCRCESRNIQLAKYQREKGIKSWNTTKINEADQS